MHRRRMLVLTALACLSPIAMASSRLANFRFGILRVISEDVFEIATETLRIPRRMKSTGFRFGVGFDNPMRESIEWYEVIHLPASPREASGTFQRSGANSLRSKTFKSDRASIVDEFWFDEGDPLGKHSLELFVDGVLSYSVNFEVVSE